MLGFYRLKREAHMDMDWPYQKGIVYSEKHYRAAEALLRSQARAAPARLNDEAHERLSDHGESWSHFQAIIAKRDDAMKIARAAWDILVESGGIGERGKGEINFNLRYIYTDLTHLTHKIDVQLHKDLCEKVRENIKQRSIYRDRAEEILFPAKHKKNEMTAYQKAVPKRFSAISESEPWYGTEQMVFETQRERDALQAVFGEMLERCAKTDFAKEPGATLFAIKPSNFKNSFVLEVSMHKKMLEALRDQIVDARTFTTSQPAAGTSR